MLDWKNFQLALFAGMVSLIAFFANTLYEDMKTSAENRDKLVVKIEVLQAAQLETLNAIKNEIVVLNKQSEDVKEKLDEVSQTHMAYKGLMHTEKGVALLVQLPGSVDVNVDAALTK